MSWAEPHPADQTRLPPEPVFEAGLLHHHVSNTAYPIAHEQTLAPYRVTKAGQRALVTQAFGGVSDLCLYLHVPFCETRCGFCEYTVVSRDEAARGAEYVSAALREIALYDALLDLGARRVHGFDIGGGTPTWLPVEELARMLEAVRRVARFEPRALVSVETTPRIAAREPHKLLALRRLGVERISMGVQVSDAALLSLLGRGRDGVLEQRRAAEQIRSAGFPRFNLDLMYGFAGQSPASWRATLEHAQTLGADAITLYRMRYKSTRIARQAAGVSWEHVHQLSELGRRVLEDAGYAAPPGKTTFSRIPGDDGTSSYLSRRVRDGMPYLGFGLGAQSLSPSTLSYNDGAVAKNLTPYLRSVARDELPLQDLYALPLPHAQAKMCAVSFYFGAIDGAAFQRNFGRPLERAFPAEVRFATARGLMQWVGRVLCLTPAGVAQLPGLIALFFAPSVQAHLLARRPGDLCRQRGALANGLEAPRV